MTLATRSGFVFGRFCGNADRPGGAGRGRRRGGGNGAWYAARVCGGVGCVYIYFYPPSIGVSCIYVYICMCLLACLYVYLYKINISASLSVQSHRPCKIRSPPMQAQVTHLGSRGHRPSDLGHRLLPLVFTGSEEKRQRHPHRWSIGLWTSAKRPIMNEKEFMATVAMACLRFI